MSIAAVKMNLEIAAAEAEEEAEVRYPFPTLSFALPPLASRG